MHTELYRAAPIQMDDIPLLYHITMIFTGIPSWICAKIQYNVKSLNSCRRWRKIEFSLLLLYIVWLLVNVFAILWIVILTYWPLFSFMTKNNEFYSFRLRINAGRAKCELFYYYCIWRRWTMKMLFLWQQ